MPAAESFIQSATCPLTFVLHDGTEVVVRNGCLIIEDHPCRPVITASNQTKDYLLAKARLTPDQRQRIAEFGDAMFRNDSPFTPREAHKIKYG